MPSPLQTTFSLTLSVSIRYDRSTYLPGLEALSIPPSNDAYEKLLRQHIAHEMREYGHPTRCDIVPSYGEPYWNITSESSGSSTSSAPGPSSVPADEDMGLCWVKMESPIYYLSPATLGEVQNVLTVLVHEFDIMDDGDAPAVRINIGNKHKGFPLQTLKSLLILTSALVTQLNSLFSLGLQKSKKEVIETRREKKQPDPWPRSLAIQSCSSLSSLLTLHAQTQTTSTSTSPPLFPIALEKKTIAFTPSLLSLDIGAILRHIVLYAALTKYAHETPFHVMTNVVEDFGSGEEKSRGARGLKGLAERMGLGELINCDEGEEGESEVGTNWRVRRWVLEDEEWVRERRVGGVVGEDEDGGRDRSGRLRSDGSVTVVEEGDSDGSLTVVGEGDEWE